MVDELRVQNFRKHNDFKVRFKPGVNIIIGKNGSGKTSLIEAIYISYQGKSWKSNFIEILNKNSDWWRVDYKDRIIKYNDSQKTFIINNKEQSRLSEKDKNAIILFEPQDLNLLYRSPLSRRSWLDNFISGLEDNYRKTVNKYNRILKQRNILLKNQAPKEQLFVWDIQFATLASEIIKNRKKYIKLINERIEEEYKKISSKKVNIILEYESKINTEQEILNTINLNYQYEINCGHTSIGPHQHDIVFKVNHKDASKTLSRGENRSLILALKNLEYELNKFKDPLILLDDILSEFDDIHQINLLNRYKNNQIIITSVKTPKIDQKVNIIDLDKLLK
ncbi:DNA replication and repair protein RecF [Ruminococcaceae bacterium OttesenSCG-928-A11]|nr:DNA replication and repair protein RecF [Ruminococcaceae bacterium OttesenSCG-928-A11]